MLPGDTDTIIQTRPLIVRENWFFGIVT